MEDTWTISKIILSYMYILKSSFDLFYFFSFSILLLSLDRQIGSRTILWDFLQPDQEHHWYKDMNKSLANEKYSPKSTLYIETNKIYIINITKHFLFTWNLFLFMLIFVNLSNQYYLFIDDLFKDIFIMMCLYLLSTCNILYWIIYPPHSW